MASWSRTCSQVACTALASGWAKIVRNSAATMSLWDLGTRASRLRAKWTRQRWCAAPAKHRDRALTSPACWSEITRRTPDRPRSFRSVRNLRQNVSSSLSPTSRPRISRVPCWVTPVATTTRLGHHLPAGGLAHVQVRRVQVHVREGGVAQGAAPERPDRLVQAGADPRHLGLRHPAPAERGDQVIHAAGRHPVHVGLHHHRVQRLVDPSARGEDLGEERALAQLRDRQLHIPGLGGRHPPARPVPLGRAGLGAFVPGRADHLGRFQLDQILQRDPHRFTDQVHALPGTDTSSNSERADWDKAIGEISFGECLAVHTKNLADGPTYLRATPLPPKPHHSLGLIRPPAGSADDGRAQRPKDPHLRRGDVHLHREIPADPSQGR